MPSICWVGALLSCLLAAPAAQAGTLTSATWLQVTEGVPMTRTTAQLGASGSSTAGSIAVSLSYPAFSVSVLVPRTPMGVTQMTLMGLDRLIKITQGGPQAITATPSMANGTPGIAGTVIVMTANHVAKGVNQSMYNPGVNTLFAVPISIGRAGHLTDSIPVLGIDQTLVMDFFAWTPGMQTFAGLSSQLMALPSVMAAGSFDLNSDGSGTVTLVSPTKISIDGISQRRTVSLTTLKLTFVPEPGTVLLLGAAAAALVLARRR